jgi:hypothetical protein
MYVCMYIADMYQSGTTHVCMYACTHKCMYAGIYVCTYVCMSPACTSLGPGMYACMYECMYVRICVSVNMYVCMYVCTSPICTVLGHICIYFRQITYTLHTRMHTFWANYIHKAYTNAYISGKLHALCILICIHFRQMAVNLRVTSTVPEYKYKAIECHLHVYLVSIYIAYTYAYISGKWL